MPDPKDAAQAALDGCGIARGQVYRHYKGGLYSIVDVAIQESTLEPVVVYRSNLKGTTWVRSLEDFTMKVLLDSGNLQPRFKREES